MHSGNRLGSVGANCDRAARKAKRDHRIDLVRGFALATIFINHMPGNWLADWTSRNFGFSDAAEVFVLLAGYAAALAFYPTYVKSNLQTVTVKAGRRAAVVYGAHLMTTLAAIVMFSAFRSFATTAEAQDLIGMGPVLDDPVTSLVAVLFGGFQLSYFNVLPLYVVLLALVPGLVWLAEKDLRLVGAVSAATYLLTNVGGLSLPNFHNFDGWFFNPLAWQCLFVAGLALGIGRCRGQSASYHRVLFKLALGYLVFSAVWMTGDFGRSVGAGVVPEWLGSLEKPNLPVVRLLHIFALAYVVCHCRVWQWLARVPAEFVLTRMGRNSLPVFMAGSLLSMAGWIVSTQVQGGPVMDAMVAAAGISGMAMLALWLENSLYLPRVRWTYCAQLAGRSKGLAHTIQ